MQDKRVKHEWWRGGGGGMVGVMGGGRDGVGCRIRKERFVG